MWRIGEAGGQCAVLYRGWRDAEMLGVSCGDRNNRPPQRRLRGGFVSSDGISVVAQDDRRDDPGCERYEQHVIVVCLHVVIAARWLLEVPAAIVDFGVARVVCTETVALLPAPPRELEAFLVIGRLRRLAAMPSALEIVAIVLAVVPASVGTRVAPVDIATAAVPVAVVAITTVVVAAPVVVILAFVPVLVLVLILVLIRPAIAALLLLVGLLRERWRGQRRDKH